MIKLHAATLLKWQAASGVAAHFERQATFEKELAKLAAKSAGKDQPEVPEEKKKGFAFDVE